MEGATDGRRRTNVVNCCDGDGAEMFSAATANPRNIPLGSDCLHFQGLESDDTGCAASTTSLFSEPFACAQYQKMVSSEPFELILFLDSYSLRREGRSAEASKNISFLRNLITEPRVKINFSTS